MLQVLGQDLATPSHLVIAWTPSGALSGGTTTALRLALEWAIPIINLGGPENANAHSALVLQRVAELVPSWTTSPTPSQGFFLTEGLLASYEFA